MMMMAYPSGYATYHNSVILHQKKMKEHFTIEQLQELYENKFSNSNSKGIDKISGINFRKNLEQELSLISKRVSMKEYSFSPYLEKLIIKNRFKKPRILSVPTIRDRITLNQLKEYLHSIIPDAVFRTIAQQCIKEIKEELTTKKYNYFIRTDLSNFYDRIDRVRLIKELAKHKIDEYALTILDQSISNTTVPKNYNKIEQKKYFREKGVPQGLSISNFLAQIYLQEFDALMKKQKCFIIRYVDDILILCNEENAESLESIAREYLKSIYLELNEDKTYKGQLNYAFEFLGYRFKSGQISIAEKNVQKRINAIAGKFTWFTKGWFDKKQRVPYLINDDEKYKSRFIDQLNNLIAGVIVENKKRSFGLPRNSGHQDRLEYLIMFKFIICQKLEGSTAKNRSWKS